VRRLLPLIVAVAAVADPVSDGADAVLAAHRAGDADALRAAAGTNDPDPWLVADELCARGEHAAAEALARASDHVDLKALPGALADMRKTDAASRAAYRAAMADLGSGKVGEALAALDGIKRAAGLHAVTLLRARGSALQRLGRHKDALTAFVAAADEAERLGWLFGAGIARFEALVSAQALGDARAMLAQAECRITLAERRKSPLELALALLEAGWAQFHLGDRGAALGRVDTALGLLDAVGPSDLARAGATQQKPDEARASALVLLSRLRYLEGDADGAALACRGAADAYGRIGSAPRQALMTGWAAWFAGEALMNAGRLGPARDRYRQAAELLAKDPWGDAAATSSLGWAETETGAYASAARSLEHALAAAQAIGDHRTRALTLMRRATLKERTGEYRAALDDLALARPLLEAMGDKRLVADAALNEGVVRWRLAEWDLAFARLAEARSLYEAAGWTRGVAATHNNEGLVHEALGDYTRSFLCLERALAVQRDSNNVAGVAATLLNIARVEEGWALGLTRAEQALRMAREVGARPLEANVLAFLGSQYLALGDLGRAVALLSEAVALKDEIGDRAATVHWRAELALALLRKGQAADARSAADRARRELDQLDTRAYDPEVLILLGVFEAEGGRPDEAKAHFEAAHESARVQGMGGGMAFCEFHLALLMESSGGAGALDACRRAASALERMDHHFLAARAAALEARLLLARHEPAEGLKAARRGIALLPNVSAGLGREEGAAVRTKLGSVFEAGARCALALGDTRELFFFMESGRAGNLLEAIGTRGRIREAAMPEALREEERQARGELLTALARGREGVAGAEQAAAAARLRLAAVAGRAQREAKGAAARVFLRPDPLEHVRSLLREGEALVSYLMVEASDEAVALVVTAGAERVVRLGPASAVAALCLDLVGGAARPGARGVTPAAGESKEDPLAAVAKLRDAVVAPLGLGREVRRLLISPHGELCYAPFALLAAEREIVLIPSATTWTQLLPQRVRSGSGVLALGGCRYRDQPDLPGSQAEAQAVGDVTLIGERATAANLAAALSERPRWRAVHLACHGFVRADQPALSSLAFTATSLDDGAWPVYEVYAARVPADLVVLSACETARGRIYRGEGVVGFTDAFLFAGAPRVIVSLWKVDDAATRALMERFYELWTPGELSTAAALKAAQAFVESRKGWEHPYYWAGWELWGLGE